MARQSNAREFEEENINHKVFKRLSTRLLRYRSVIMLQIIMERRGCKNMHIPFISDMLRPDLLDLQRAFAAALGSSSGSIAVSRSVSHTVSVRCCAWCAQRCYRTCMF